VKGKAMTAIHDIRITRPGLALDRRSFCRSFGALSGAAALHTLGMPTAVAAPAPPLRIDAHCHLFNGRDLPIYGLLESVIIQQNVFGIFAEPLAQFLAATIENNAPTYVDEVKILDGHLIPNPAAIVEYKRNSERAAEFLERGLKKFIDKYTSFGSDAQNPPNSRYDGFLLELLLRYAPSSAIESGKSKSEIVSSLRDKRFRDRIIEQLLANGKPRTRMSFDDEFGEYLAQFCFWAAKFLDYHFQLADDLGGLFGENDGNDELRIITPAIDDFGPWPLKWWYTDDVTQPLQQAKLFQKIALIQPKGRKLHGLIGFDPWHYLQDLHDKTHPNALEVVQTAIEQFGFVGVKLYPPMGFRASNNTALPKDSFPENLRRLYNNPGPKLDWALDQLYAYSNDNKIAIQAHGAASIGSRPNYIARAEPIHWTSVLRRYTSLRVNLGHFGGIWDYFTDAACGPRSSDVDAQWPKQIAHMIRNLANLYCDVADFSGVLERWDSEKCSTPDIFAGLKQLLKGNDHLRSRVLYGSDWVMLDREPRSDGYYNAMRREFSKVLKTADLEAFLGQNAAAFFGLGHGQPTRKRIDDFYIRNKLTPPELDRYVLR
jgi:predicted TIM-barrel fold metal-dependent hydrolase